MNPLDRRANGAAGDVPVLRVLHIGTDHVTEIDGLPQALPAQGFVWVGFARAALETRVADVQAALQRWTGGSLVDLHVSDLLNAQLPSQFDDTSWYDLMVFRRLAARVGSTHLFADTDASTLATTRDALAAIDTNPVGFAVFDRVLLSVHPADCMVRESMAQRLAAQAAGQEQRGAARLPASPADLMLRTVNHMVDGYLDLRRLLSRHLTLLQQALLDPRGHFQDWGVLLDARSTLQWLQDVCEDQRSAVQEWIDALEEWPDEAEPERQRERELLRVRSRDVLEHIQRVLSHVDRLERSAETAVQMHFSALGHRTNDIMRTLTVLTALFLPLNLITGFFGMNFDGLPLIHSKTGVAIAIGMMATVLVVLVGYFWRMRYLGNLGSAGASSPSSSHRTRS